MALLMENVLDLLHEDAECLDVWPDECKSGEMFSLHSNDWKLPEKDEVMDTSDTASEAVMVSGLGDFSDCNVEDDLRSDSSQSATSRFSGKTTFSKCSTGSIPFRTLNEAAQAFRRVGGPQSEQSSTILHQTLQSLQTDKLVFPAQRLPIRCCKRCYGT